MRNILEFPVTTDEVIACLEKYRNRAMVSQMAGNMDVLLLGLAISAVRYRELKLWERDDAEGMKVALDKIK